MVICIIQARMGSTRLPGKSLMDLNGRPSLDWVYKRVCQSKLIDKVIVATSEDSIDDEIEKFCIDNKIHCFRGDNLDVLDRYYKCASHYKASVVVRVTGDCPLIDPEVIDKAISKYLDASSDVVYVSNVTERTYPDGLDVEVFSYESLKEAWTNARLDSEREHVTPYIRNNFNNITILNDENYSSIRLTLDYEEDYTKLDLMLKNISPNGEMFGLKDIVKFLNENPEIDLINKKHFS